jgi:hypothetical protein
MVKIFDVYVCVDCGFYLANGEPDDGGEARRNGWNPDEIARRWEGYHLVNGDSEKDHDFSWSACEGCGSRLGGARMHCQAWEDSWGPHCPWPMQLGEEGPIVDLN